MLGQEETGVSSGAGLVVSQSWMLSRNGRCDGTYSAMVDLQVSSPLFFFFLSEKVEDNSWEGVEE